MLKIVQAPNPVLSQKAKPVRTIDKTIHNLLEEMTVTLDNASDPEGVGLAAPQIDKSLQIFIVRETPESSVMTFINPVIINFFEKPIPEIAQGKQSKKKKERNVQLEGCLSLKDIWGIVTRHYGVELSYQDENGEKQNKKFTGFMSTIIQHEFDHLNGILFPKRVLEQNNQLYHSRKNKKGETEFEEMEL